MSKSKKVNPASARYTPLVEWSEEDGIFIGRCPEIFHGGVHGTDRAAVYQELCEVIDEWIKIMEGDGEDLPAPLKQDFSGKFLLRCEPQLHKLLALRALGEGDSLNAYCVKKLADR